MVPFTMLVGCQKSSTVSKYTYMFRKQFKLSSKEEKALLSFNLFAPLLYLSLWFSCTFPEDAAINDLLLLKKYETYKSFDEKISQTAAATLERHLWYLSK